MYSENTDRLRPNIWDVNRNSSLHESQNSAEKLYVGNTDELDSQEEEASMNFNLEEVRKSESEREEMVNDNDVDVAWNIGKEGHVKDIISKFS